LSAPLLSALLLGRALVAPATPPCACQPQHEATDDRHRQHAGNETDDIGQAGAEYFAEVAECAANLAAVALAAGRFQIDRDQLRIDAAMLLRRRTVGLLQAGFDF